MHTGAVSLVKVVLFQFIFTWVVKCNQYFQVLFAHINLQSKCKLIQNLLFKRGTHQKIHRRLPLITRDKTISEVAGKIVVGSFRLCLNNAAD